MDDELHLRDREEDDCDDWEKMDVPEYGGETIEICPNCGELLIYQDRGWEDRDTEVEVYYCPDCDDEYYAFRSI